MAEYVQIKAITVLVFIAYMTQVKCQTFQFIVTFQESSVTNELLPKAGYTIIKYRGADKSLAQPGGKQARKHVRDKNNFNNIETPAVIKFFFPARQSAEGNSRHSNRNISLFPSWLG